MSARVYADVKGGKCACGGVFTKREPYRSGSLLLLPVCIQCGKDPSLFVIDTDAKDVNGNKIPFRIRHTKDGERLDSRENVAYIIKVIQKEISEGTFNIRMYASAKNKESFIFKNYIIEYLKFQELRVVKSELTPKGLIDKKGLIKRELLPYFGKYELFRINPALINRFKDSYIDKFRTRDLALCELKALLNQAQRDELITTTPKFDPIPRAKGRNEIITKDLADKTISKITKEIYRDMYRILVTYPIRPGELRALMWKDVDFSKGTFKIRQHFSSDKLLQGRKSVKEDKKEGSLIFSMNDEALEIFRKYRRAEVVSISSFVFLSHSGKQVSEDALWEAWSNARKILKHKFAPYECRHVAASQLYIKSGFNILRTKEVGGWRNISTVERYAKDVSDNSELFQ